MYALNRYIIKQIISVSFLLIAILTMLLWLTQSVRFLEFLLDGSANFIVFLKFLSLTIPNILLVVIPIAFGVSVIVVFNKLINERELIVMRASGMGNLQFMKPVLVVALFFMMILYGLTLKIVPLSEGKLQEMRAYLVANVSISMIKTGQFNHLNDLTIYVDSKSSDAIFNHVLVVDNRDPLKSTTIIAARAEIVPKAGEQASEVTAYNGYRQEKDLKTGKVDQIFFGSYQFDYLSKTKAVNIHRQKRSMNLAQLNQLIAQKKSTGGRLGKIQTEKYSRFGVPLYALVFGLGAAYFMIYSSFRRMGQMQQIFKAILLIAALQGWMIAQSSLIKKQPDLYVLIYDVPLIALIILGVMMVRNNGKIQG